MTVIGAASLIPGMRLRDRVDVETYRRRLRRLLLGMALVLTVQYFAGL